jgi:hypothetical protein
MTPPGEKNNLPGMDSLSEAATIVANKQEGAGSVVSAIEEESLSEHDLVVAASIHGSEDTVGYVAHTHTDVVTARITSKKSRGPSSDLKTVVEDEPDGIENASGLDLPSPSPAEKEVPIISVRPSAVSEVEHASTVVKDVISDK